MKTLAQLIIDKTQGTNGQTQYAITDAYWLYNQTATDGNRTLDADTASVAEQGSYDAVTGIWSVGNLDAGQAVTLSISVTAD